MLKVADLSNLFEEVDEIAATLPPEAKTVFDLVSAVVHIQIDMDMRLRSLEPCRASASGPHVWEDIAFPQGMSCRNCGVPKVSPMMREEPTATVSPVSSAILVVRQSETLDLRVVGATEIAAATEALAIVDEHVSRALCAVLDRLGGDGACAFMNGDSPEQVSDAIFRHVRELEERALSSSADPSYECDAICPSPALAEGNRCHVKGPHKIHEAVSKLTSGWPDHLTRDRAK